MYYKWAAELLGPLLARVRSVSNIWGRKATGKVSIFLFLLSVVDLGELLAVLGGYVWAKHKASKSNKQTDIKSAKTAKRKVSEVLRKSTIKMGAKHKAIFKHLVARIIGLMKSALKSKKTYKPHETKFLSDSMAVLNLNKGVKAAPSKDLVISEAAKPGDTVLWFLLAEAVVLTLFDLMDSDDEFEGSSPSEHTTESDETLLDWLSDIWSDENGNKTTADENPFPKPRENNERTGMGGNLKNFRIQVVDTKPTNYYNEEEQIANDVGVSIHQLRSIKARL